VSVGRLTEQKDLPTLLRAFALLQRHQPTRLVVLGRGPLRDRLAKLAVTLGIEALVRFLEPRPNPYPLMARADAVVMSSAWEGFGLVLLEALALGVPVVATDCPSGPAEILDRGRYGRLVPVGDAEELAAAVVATLADGASHRRGEERAAEFSEEAFLAAYLDLIAAVST
jgi:glycosyltransferase involved in cell wall biosynthesis